MKGKLMNCKFVCLFVVIALIDVAKAEEIERKWTSKSGHTINAKLSHHDATNIYLSVEGRIQPVSKSLISSNDLDFLKSVPIKQRFEIKSSNTDQKKVVYFPTQQQLDTIEQLRQDIWGLQEEIAVIRHDSGEKTKQKIDLAKGFIDLMDKYYLHLRRANPILFPNIDDYATKEIIVFFRQLQKRESYLKDYNIDSDPRYGFHSKHYEMARIYLIWKYTECYTQEIKRGQTPTKFDENIN